jgi:plastocyanin
MLGRLSLALSLIVLVACSDDVDSNTTSSTGATGGTTQSGGAGAAGGAGQGGTATSAGGSGGSPEPMCGPDIAFTSYFGCDVTALTDMTAESNVTIGYGFSNNEFIYEPKCLHICAGATVTFDEIDGTNFQIHPLQGGVSPPVDPDSPFGTLADPNQTTASFTLTEPGSYPYYCISHLNVGMAGVVYVQ